ncbi:MAG TPA: ABC transporter permease [Vicinamibacterales bacterium]|jgi:predicted permease|nr:ABC transporter permease [Vicinamibacterales bacterium]
MSALKLAFRTLFKTPLVTTVAILSLALGIGANAAIFSCFNEILLASLAVPHPGELVNFSAPGPKPGSQSCGQAGDCDAVFSYPMFRDLQKLQTVFTGVAAHIPFGANLAYERQTVNGQGLLVSGSYFPVLELTPAVGRLLDPNDDRALGVAPVVVLSHAYWATRFGADPGVLNKTMLVNGQTLTIVGVAPAGFTGTTLGLDPQVFVPITMRGVLVPGFRGFERRDSYWAYLFARLKTGVSIEQASAGINAQYHAIVNDVEAAQQKGMSDQTLARFRAKPLGVTPGGHGQSSLPKEAKVPLQILMGVTGLVLLIACANIANLLLARSAARSGEMAIRLSIGAGRWQLIRQLLTESCLMALLGGIAGLFVARATLALILSLIPPRAAEAMHFKIDGTVVLFAAGLSILTGLMFGLFPALHSTRPDLVSTLKGISGQPSGAKGAKWFRTGLATAQIALSMTLLAAAGLFLKSLINVSRVDLGLRSDHMLTFGISPSLNGYTSERTRLLIERLEADLSHAPGITAATVSMVPALSGSNWGNDVRVQGFPAGPDTDTNSRFNEVGPGYFRAMGIPLMAGREFTDADGPTSPKVAVVNQAFVKKFNLGSDAVGKMMSEDDSAKLDMTIVGIVKDAKYSEVKGEIPPLYFVPYRQDKQVSRTNFYVRTAADPTQSAATVKNIVGRADPNLPLESLKTLDRQVEENTFLDRMMSTLSTLFAMLATVLAAVGLYGVLAFTVTQRTREIGLRMALGAAPGRVRGMVLRQVGYMTLAGGAIGLLGAYQIGKGAGSLLYEMHGSDPAILALAAVLLGAVAMMAGFIPALRASRIDPMRALRYE